MPAAQPIASEPGGEDLPDDEASRPQAAGDVRALAGRLLGGVATVAAAAADRCADAARVARFTRGRLAFQPRPDDVFVLTYPRSGTTWTQLIVHLLVEGGGLDFGHIAEVTPWWERHLAVGTATAEDFAALPGPRVFKSHLLPRWVPRGVRRIYVTRDGRDVAASYYRLYQSHLGYRGDWDAFLARFLRGALQYGSWFEHVASWRAVADQPHTLLLGYEEMRADPRAAVQRIARFLGVAASAARIDEVTRLASIESMKAHEDKFDHIGELIAERRIQRGSFIHKGQVGGGAHLFDQEQDRRFEHTLEQTRIRNHVHWRIADFLH